MKYHIIPVTSFKQNCSILWCQETGKAALIDPGGEAFRLRQEVSALGVTVQQIWITHGHLDHVGAASELAAFYRVPIIGPHYEDKPLLQNLPGQCQLFGMEFITPLIPDHWLIDRVMLSLGKLLFTVLHCPGHSPGHVVFWNQAEKFIFMGDVLFKNGIGRTDLPGGNIKTLMHSINYQLMPLADDIVFLPGHGLMSTLGDERRNQSIL
ncbi:MBL fold metallo-hydrolase [Candidatus Steffania adelgidicola]|uniref:MBL fold metallo-hydrolase n=1 Tax=Candidatus Steffania adelgidicola TaxID=1076626 RepID=UPI001D02EC25|nr:MBL fold metallo-hydrolase [Candidatus Steffania adelgidicola]UDG79967.1 Hydroxyacylglutathione hydrolase GloC [Candidatus Steffania adelgidicola]